MSTFNQILSLLRGGVPKTEIFLFLTPTMFFGTPNQGPGRVKNICWGPTSGLDSGKISKKGWSWTRVFNLINGGRGRFESHNGAYSVK